MWFLKAMTEKERANSNDAQDQKTSKLKAETQPQTVTMSIHQENFKLHRQSNPHLPNGQTTTSLSLNRQAKASSTTTGGLGGTEFSLNKKNSLLRRSLRRSLSFRRGLVPHGHIKKEELFAILRGEDERVKYCAVNDDGSILACEVVETQQNKNETFVYVWSLRTGQVLFRRANNGCEMFHKIESIAFGKTKLVTVSHRKKYVNKKEICAVIQVYNLNSGRVMRRFEVDNFTCFSLAVQGDFIIAGGGRVKENCNWYYRDLVYVWSIPRDKLILFDNIIKTELIESTSVRGVAVQEDKVTFAMEGGRLFATSLKALISSKKLKCTLLAKEDDPRVLTRSDQHHSVAIQDDIIVTGFGNSVKVIQVSKKRSVTRRVFHVGAFHHIQKVAVKGDLFACSVGSELYVWHLNTEKLIFRVEHGNVEASNYLATIAMLQDVTIDSKVVNTIFASDMAIPDAQPGRITIGHILWAANLPGMERYTSNFTHAGLSALTHYTDVAETPLVLRKLGINKPEHREAIHTELVTANSESWQRLRANFQLKKGFVTSVRILPGEKNHDDFKIRSIHGDIITRIWSKEGKLLDCHWTTEEERIKDLVTPKEQQYQQQLQKGVKITGQGNRDLNLNNTTIYKGDSPITCVTADNKHLVLGDEKGNVHIVSKSSDGNMLERFTRLFTFYS